MDVMVDGEVLTLHLEKPGRAALGSATSWYKNYSMSQKRRERQSKEAPVEEAPQKDPAFLRKVIIGVVILAAFGAAYYFGYEKRARTNMTLCECLRQKGA